MRALRESAGLSLLALANRVQWSKAAVGHAETGARTVSPDLARALDTALGAGGVLIALAATERDQGRNLDDVKRRTLLKGLAAGGAAYATLLPPPSGRVSVADVAPLLERTAELRRLDDVVGGADTFALYLAEVEKTQAILTGASHNAATRRALLAALAEQSQLCGWAAFDAGWVNRSEQLYQTSRDAAAEADDPGLFANAMALDAYQRAFGGEPDPTLAQASCDALTDRTPPGVRALILDRAAYTFAVAGMTGEAETALGHAAAALADPGGPPTPDWAAWVDPVELDIMTGRCWAALRRPLRAVPPLERALAQFPDEYARDRALYTLALAEAYLHARELELAAQTIQAAHELTRGLASTRPATQLRRTMALSARVSRRR